MKRAILIIVAVLIADQALKFWIKTTMTIGQEIHVMGNWFILHFTENEGMAFGLSLGGDAGKLLLSTFRIIAAIVIGVYIYRLTKKDTPKGLIASFSLIMAGAIGNILDSAYFGLIFSESSYHSVAVLFPEGGGYSSFLHGKVVDMLYFPIINTRWPGWVPVWGGQQLVFFRPVFNLADSAITCGVLSLIIFQKRFYGKKKVEEVSEVENEVKVKE